MNNVIAVVAAGEMGCSIGERLRGHGARVLTSLAGRSAATVERATRAGLIDDDDDAIAASDFILSIVPPKDAMAIAQRFHGPLQRSSKKAVYIDCNAVSVETVAAIEKVVAVSGARFVDGSIIGAPGRMDQTGPTLHLSGELPQDVTTLTALGLRAQST
ncbi:MAG TPA: NAD(P)-binding domain-containing protein, partial [Steroidobacteraceae bacterium]|nr:NAD(P)-binding domain-containing protein [Steroidobacteraceae bacterium]